MKLGGSCRDASLDATSDYCSVSLKCRRDLWEKDIALTETRISTVNLTL
jgi:hypothetical protein